MLRTQYGYSIRMFFWYLWCGACERSCMRANGLLAAPTEAPSSCLWVNNQTEAALAPIKHICTTILICMSSSRSCVRACITYYAHKFVNARVTCWVTGVWWMGGWGFLVRMGSMAPARLAFNRTHTHIVRPSNKNAIHFNAFHVCIHTYLLRIAYEMMAAGIFYFLLALENVAHARTASRDAILHLCTILLCVHYTRNVPRTCALRPSQAICNNACMCV